ncbi:MAG: GntR family transcriptional regulator [Ruminococcaceae bacterium]|nr:GntR family transcriptional regulator [Oscillospiraceae bacterium]
MVISRESGSLESRVYEALEDAILAGEFKAGTPLTELGVSEKLGVSRTPVRAALHRLDEEGLVELSPNRGAVVVGVTGDDLVDIYRIRMRLEGLASAMAAEKMTEEDKKALRDKVELSEFYIQRRDTENIKELDTAFHSEIYKKSGSRMLCKILSDLHRSIRAYRKLSLSAEGRLEVSVREHREILEAILRSDAAEAERLTALHIENAMKSTLGAIDN